MGLQCSIKDSLSGRVVSLCEMIEGHISIKNGQYNQVLLEHGQVVLRAHAIQQLVSSFPDWFSGAYDVNR